jgi:hypothetical protein
MIGCITDCVCRQGILRDATTRATADGVGTLMPALFFLIRTHLQKQSLALRERARVRGQEAHFQDAAAPSTGLRPPSPSWRTEILNLGTNQVIQVILSSSGPVMQQTHLPGGLPFNVDAGHGASQQPEPIPPSVSVRTRQNLS